MELRVFTCICLFLFASAFAGVLYQAGDVSPDETVTRLDVEADGDATFVLEIRTSLDTDAERASFESFAEEVENDPEASVSGFRNSVVSLVERASNETGRDMSVSNFTVETRTEPLPVERGIVEYTFEWDGFAEADGELRAGDVLSGYILSEGDALVLRPPEGYEASSVDPTPDSEDGAVRWNGPEGFADDQPRVVLSVSDEGGENGTENGGAPTDGGPASVDGEPSGGTGTDGNAGAENGVPLYFYAVAVVVVLSIAALGYRTRADTGGAAETEETTGESGVEAPPGEQKKVEEGGRVTEGETKAEEVLSDDERVLRMIETEGGRMKQKHLVEETGWSEAKVSKLTSRMEEEGEITKIRLGRENILEIKDEDEEEDEFGY